MLRRCVSFAFGLALMVALGFATVHAEPIHSSGGTTRFSAPCEPAQAVFKAARESSVVSTPDWTFGAENAVARAGAVCACRVEVMAQPIRPAAIAAYPPLFHRPPPANS